MVLAIPDAQGRGRLTVPVIAWFLSPIGRYVGIFLVTIAILGGLYWKIRGDARSDAQLEIMHNTLERITNAIRRGDAVSTDPSKLHENDGHCRDCQ
jgi:Flp pilus assembly protein TadB